MADTPNLIRATSNLPQVLVGAQLTGSDAEVYACPALKSVVIATATLCNTAGASRVVNLSVVKAGDSSGVANRIAVITLEQDESCVVDELMGLMLGPGDSIYGDASAATSVSIVLTGAVSS